MPHVTFIEPGGRELDVEVEAGLSVMEAAQNNGVPGIWGDCGGACSCATCHVYVDPDWIDRIAPKDENEESMLECATGEVLPRLSRLSCQITMTDELDGLVVRVPEDH